MDYKIEGGNLPVLIVNLNRGETIITQSGGMSWMSDTISMATESGGFKKAFSRMVGGESAFVSRYTAEHGDGVIAFSSSFPGDIIDYDIEPGKDLIVQKKAFLASEDTVDLSIYFQKKIGAGLVGGEGFFMQRASGQGKLFLEIDGALITKDLEPGETLFVDNGYIAFMEDTVDYDIERIKGVKNVLLGGEGLFLAKVTGPGKIGLQTQPLAQHIQTILPYLDVLKDK
ncbi:MAG: TIGR00266 family protein [Tissierellia bacterium]|nr:TIGR00266 family protein [Tissierellia bacterium]